MGSEEASVSSSLTLFFFHVQNRQDGGSDVSSSVDTNEKFTLKHPSSAHLKTFHHFCSAWLQAKLFYKEIGKHWQHLLTKSQRRLSTQGRSDQSALTSVRKHQTWLSGQQNERGGNTMSSKGWNYSSTPWRTNAARVGLSKPDLPCWEQAALGSRNKEENLSVKTAITHLELKLS